VPIVETRAGLPAGSGVGASNTGAAAAITATLAAVAGKRTFLTAFCVSGAGATAASVITVTITGLAVTLSYKLAVPAGAAVGVTPLMATFPQPIPASADNTAIVVNVPSFGAGNLHAAVVASGYQL
jgi:hypothetical protein